MADGHPPRPGGSIDVAMKAGQLLWSAVVGSAMPGAARGALRQALTRFCDETPPVPPGLVTEAIAVELGQDALRTLAGIDPAPLAVTAISQVHSAVLGDGRRVVVKAQCPRAGQVLRAALSETGLRTVIGPLIQDTVPTMTGSGIEAAARDLADRADELVDLRTRAAWQREFAAAYQGHPLIRVPSVLSGLSGQRVLTMDWSDGLSWAQARLAADRQRAAWGEVICQFTVGSLHERGLRPAGGQPGGYLFHPDGGVTFLGFGSVERCSPGRLAAAAGDIAVELTRLLADLGATAPYGNGTTQSP